VLLLLIIIVISNVLAICAGAYALQSLSTKIGYKTISKYPLPPIIIRKIYIDRHFTKDEKTIIKKALKAWELLTNGLVRLRIVDESAVALHEGYDRREQHSDEEFCSRFYISKGLSTDGKIQQIDEYEKATIWGYAYMTYVPRVALIVTDRLKNKNILQAVIMHEIGHLLGIPHSWQQFSLMHQYCSAKKMTVTENDMRYVIWTALRDYELRGY